MKSCSKLLLVCLPLLAIVIQGCGPRPTLTVPPVTPATTPITPTPSSVPEGVTIEVTSAADRGPGSLRQALLEAKAGDTIVFDGAVFPPDSPQTIALDSELPALVEGQLTIDASDAGVILYGGNITARESVGLAIFSSDNTVRGLQIAAFSKAGVALQGGAQSNTIGGDRKLGAGPVGQGNLISGRGGFGVGLWGLGTSFNTVRGNLIGTDLEGTRGVGALSQGVFSDGADHNLIEDNVIGGYLDHGIGLCCAADATNTVRGNWIGTGPGGMAELTAGSWYGIAVDRAGGNVIGPNNVVANNDRAGIAVFGEEAVSNQITRNSLYDNGGTGGDIYLALGIELWDGGNLELAAPVLLNFDLPAGTLTGLACPGCTVEVFSNQAEEGAFYEGETAADGSGHFVFKKGVAFTGPQLTATATDAEGSTSQFSVPTPNVPSRSVNLQLGTGTSRAPIVVQGSDELKDNHLGGGWELDHILKLGAKRARFSINAIESNLVDWSRPEFEIDPQLDEFVTTLADSGVELTLTLSFWDKANYPQGWQVGPGYSRFRTQEEIDRYLAFVQFVVGHFHDRVSYYELWNEPDNAGLPLDYIQIPDYINLVEQVVPVIRGEYPEAKIVVGSVSNLQYTEHYLRRMLQSAAIMPAVDVVAWHPFYGASPSYGYSEQYGDPSAYYERYPSLVQELKDLAVASGFEGGYQVSEMGWPTADIAVVDQPWRYSPTVAAKYYARGAVMHLGMGIDTIAGGMTPAYVPPYAAIQRLCTIMAGAVPGEVAVELVTEAENVTSYSFSSPGGGALIALWSDGAAVEHDPGAPATVVLAGLGERSVTGIDVLLGYEQPLKVESEDGDLIVRDLLIKDYPILLRLDN